MVFECSGTNGGWEMPVENESPLSRSLCDVAQEMGEIRSDSSSDLYEGMLEGSRAHIDVYVGRRSMIGIESGGSLGIMIRDLGHTYPRHFGG